MLQQRISCDCGTKGDERMRERDAAIYLQVSVFTLRNWRHLGQGPCYAKLGKPVVYLKSDLDLYISQNRVDPSSKE